MALHVLGVNCGIHDGAAAVLRDGELVALVESERLIRVKRAIKRSPAPAVQAALDLAGISLDSIDAVAVGWDAPLYPETESASWSEAERAVLYEWILDESMASSSVFGEARLRAPRALQTDGLPPLQFVPHHAAHAAASFWTSGLDTAGIVVADGRGELHATSIGVGDASGITFPRRWDITQSLGNYYGYAAEWAGLDFWDAGKLMGLAAYGRPSQPLPLVSDSSGYRFDGLDAPCHLVDDRAGQQRTFLRDWFSRRVYPFTPGDRTEIMAYADFASSVQRSLEDAMLVLGTLATRVAQTDHLVIAGGVGMNCSMVGRLSRATDFAEVYVPPFTYDCGVALGAAITVDRRSRSDWQAPRRLPHAYFGSGFDALTTRRALERTDLVVRSHTPDDLVDSAADCLARDEVIAWFQGRAEVGQRALGARSILANPRSRTTHTRVNALKSREMWRPLAPVVTAERFHDLFEGPRSGAADFMLIAAPVRRTAAPLLPAVVHVDLTARPQVVHRTVNPQLWALLEAFRERTGCPALMNTSFNLAGEPIVHSPDDAVSTFIRSSLDALFIGPYEVRRTRADG